MGLLSYRFKARLNDEPWRFDMKFSTTGYTYIVNVNGEVIMTEKAPNNGTAMLKPYRLTFEYKGQPYDVDFGTISIWGYGVHVYKGGEQTFRTKNKDFIALKRTIKLSEKIDDLIDTGVNSDVFQKQKELSKELNKELRPSLITDIILGVIFFFIAKEFGLITAALAGAAVTIALYFIQKIVKMDLLGGFAKFGVVMSLISAGLALFFQSDLLIKLKGTFVGLIGVSLAAIDGWKGGNFIGKPMARYMSGIMTLDPKRAAFALAVSSLILITIDLPLVFLLTTDQWIFYNAFLDTLVAIPIIIGVMWLARER